jgi:hypothetical protein
MALSCGMRVPLLLPSTSRLYWGVFGGGGGVRGASYGVDSSKIPIRELVAARLLT